MAHKKIHPDASTSQDDALDAIIRTSRLRQNAGGYWQIVYSEPAGDGAWRSKTFSTQTKDFAKAQNALTEWLTTVRQQQLDGLKAKGVTIGSLIDLYLNTLNPRKRKIAEEVLVTVRKTLGGLDPKDLTQQVVVDYSRTRINHITGQAIKSGTLRRELSAMLTAIKHAIDQRIIASTDGPTKLKLPDDSPPRLLYLKHDEEQRFWTAAQARGGQIGLFVALGLETAARKSAILDLTWDRVNFRTSKIDYQDPDVPVTGKRRAVVPMSTRLRPVLEKAQLASNSNRLFDSRLRTSYETWTKRIGMEWVTPHVLRHTWASLAAIDGVPLYHIAKMLGDTISTVEKTYAKLAPDDLRAVVDRPRKVGDAR